MHGDRKMSWMNGKKRQRKISAIDCPCCRTTSCCERAARCKEGCGKSRRLQKSIEIAEWKTTKETAQTKRKGKRQQATGNRLNRQESKGSNEMCVLRYACVPRIATPTPTPTQSLAWSGNLSPQDLAVSRDSFEVRFGCWVICAPRSWNLLSG